MSETNLLIYLGFAFGLFVLLPYASVVIVPRWWQAFALVAALSCLTLYSEFSWNAFHNANPNHGGKFAGFETVIFAFVTAIAALGLFGRICGQWLINRGIPRIVRIAIHGSICTVIPLALAAYRNFN